MSPQFVGAAVSAPLADWTRDKTSVYAGHELLGSRPRFVICRNEQTSVNMHEKLTKSRRSGQWYYNKEGNSRHLACEAASICKKAENSISGATLD